MRDGAGDVGGAVCILAAGVDEIERVAFELELGRFRRPVMHDGAVRALTAEMVSKLMSLSWPVSRRNPSSFTAAETSSSRPLAAVSSSQARKRASATPSRKCAARAPSISVAFLIALGRMQGSPPGTNLAPAASSAWAKRTGAVSGSRRTLAPSLPSFTSFSSSAEGSSSSTSPRLPRTLSPSLAGSMNRLGLSACRDDGVSERERRVPDVAAADVEQPGDGIEQGDEDGVGLLLLQDLLHLADLVLGAAPGELQPMRHHGRGRRRGPFLPEEVEGVGALRSKLDACLAQTLRQPLDLLDGVQVRVVADRVA